MGNGRARVTVTMELEVEVTRYSGRDTLEDSAVEAVRQAMLSAPPVVGVGLFVRSMHDIRARLINGPNFNRPDPTEPGEPL